MSEARTTPAPRLRDLPGIDRLLDDPGIDKLCQRFGRLTVKQQLQALQNGWRASGEPPPWAAEPAAYAAALAPALDRTEYRPVINLTGTVLHSNLGRAPLSPEIVARVTELITRPASLEYDVAVGRRGDRDEPVAARLRTLTGAEDATVVNNNAAAVLLVLNTLALNRSVPVSRGELIEIGGSFRLPDIMARAGCRLVEVGATNRTHPADYRNAVDVDTGCLLKIHPSNYHIEGFTKSVSLTEMAVIANESTLPLVIDLGSGTLVNLERWGLPHEPTPTEMLNQGADLVTFSGDKLLGAVQSGIIVGRRDLIQQVKRNPLKRALRPDKVTLTILQETLKLYEEPDSLPQTIPLLQQLLTPMEELEERARSIADTLRDRLPGFTVAVEPGACQLGSGSLPDQEIASLCVVVGHNKAANVRRLETRLRQLPTPVIGRISQDRLWLDMRGAADPTALIESLARLDVTGKTKP